MLESILKHIEGFFGWEQLLFLFGMEIYKLCLVAA